MTKICLALIQISGLGTLSESLVPHIPKATGLFDLALERASLAAEIPHSSLTVLEFYSGIGGLRVSLEQAVEAASFRSALETRVSSFDINTVANSVRIMKTVLFQLPAVSFLSGRFELRCTRFYQVSPVDKDCLAGRLRVTPTLC